MFEIINVFFAAPGMILAILELSDRFCKKSLKTTSTEESPTCSHASSSPISSDSHSIHIHYENRKTILQIVSTISLGIACLITIFEFYNVGTPPKFIKNDWMFPEVFTIFINKILFCFHHLAEMCLFLLIGLSAFAIFHHIITKIRTRLHFITYIVVLFSSISINFSWSKIPFSVMIQIYHSPHSPNTLFFVLQRLMPFAIMVTWLILFIIILQLIQMLYLPTLSSKYLRKQLRIISQTLFIPLILACLSIYWACLL